MSGDQNNQERAIVPFFHGMPVDAVNRVQAISLGPDLHKEFEYRLAYAKFFVKNYVGAVKSLEEIIVYVRAMPLSLDDRERAHGAALRKAIMMQQHSAFAARELEIMERILDIVGFRLEAAKPVIDVAGPGTILVIACLVAAVTTTDETTAGILLGAAVGYAIVVLFPVLYIVILAFMLARAKKTVKSLRKAVAEGTVTDAHMAAFAKGQYAFLAFAAPKGRGFITIYI
ncbi:hypothetical protein ACHAPT_007096 [Fusarium lateritium]